MINDNIIKTFWDNNKFLYDILKNSDSYKTAQSKIQEFISEQWTKIYSNEDIQLSLELHIQINALRVLRRVTSIRSQKLTDFNLMKSLWNLANNISDKNLEVLQAGFFEEITHLFKAIKGESGIYDDFKHLDFQNEKDRKAAILRSEYLKKVTQKLNSYVNRYPHGLQDDIIEKRKNNKKRILDILKGTEDDWNDYKWHLKNVVRDAETLNKLIDLTDDEIKAITKAKQIKIPFGITPYYISLMDKETSRDNDHAVRAQVIPPLHYVNVMEKYRGDAEYCADFMLERDTSPIDLVTRRYPEIAIFKPYNTCSQICVYCQRNWQITDVLDPAALSSKQQIEEAYEWFRNNPEVEEVLITGGDPFILSTEILNDILGNLSKMDHIKRIRLGSRTPVVLPQRITIELADIIKSYHKPGTREINIVTHFEHVYEVTPEAMTAVQMFKERGMSVYNQAVFTFENSRKFELVALRKQLRAIGIDSYYTFNTKGKEETNNYRVPIARLIQETNEEARLTPGLVRTDEPVYNVPRLGKNYIRAAQHHSLLTILPDGKRMYEFHPWEKNLALADTYIDIDVSIYDYLKELEKRGEDINDYKSIWYYY